MYSKVKMRIASILLIILFSFVGFIAVFPLLALAIASLKPSTELMRQGINLNLQWDLISLNNYTFLFTDGTTYLNWYFNSIMVSGILIVVSLFFSSIVGYALAVYKFRGQNLVFLLVLLTLMIPFEILMLPLYQLMATLGLMNTYTGVMLPMIVAPIAVFFFRQFSLGLPKELLDAARIDGCTEFGIFFRIMAPLMVPAFAAMAILQGLFSWNNFLWPLVVLRSNDMFTLPVGLATLLTPYGNNYDVLISGSVLSVVPILFLFLFFQKYFISGLSSGGVKG
ncbi:carbohydrate ABC transporter permease [Evansella sp. AB-rgal1]|uniref:carbohydrate ABC transporter permease n=1 Tax=Evansella sp. AB-rgal1 TaxID=3242696 RepID=UPI00359D7092